MGKQRAGKNENFTDSMVMAGIPIAIIYWVLDSILNIFFYNKYNVLAEIFGPNIYEIYTRIVVLCLLILFGAHAQSSINKLKNARDALRQKESEHRAFIENLTVGVFRCTIAEPGRFVRANPAAVSIFGYRGTEELLDASLVELAAEPSTLEAFVSETRSKGRIFGRELLMKKRDGTIFWAACSAATKAGADGKIRWIDAVIEDIGARKKVEDALRSSEERYRQLVNAAPAGICEVDLRTGAFQQVNDVFCEMTGYSRDELMAGRCYDFMAAESRKKFFDILIKLHAGRSVPESVEIILQRKDGETLWTAMKSKYDYEFGKLKSATVVVHDISRRVEAEQEKHRLQSRLHRAQKMEAIGTLAGGIAHDFNNLLMGIQGHISLMMSKTDYLHPYFNHLLTIENHIKSATDLTGKLLGFAKGEKNERAVVDVNALVKDQVAMFAQSRKDIRIQQKLEEELWSVTADSVQIKQVLLNIIVNAMQAMPKGGEITIKTENTVIDPNRLKSSRTASGDYVRIMVGDTGIGMDKTTVRRVFEPFFTTKKLGPQKGIGLGLSTAYGIAKNHGGFITVSSEPGKGSVFNIYLPAVREPIAEQAQDPEEAASEKETVLAIDDNHDVLNILGDMLERLGYNTLKANNGNRALELFSRTADRISLVIMDSNIDRSRRKPLAAELKKIKPEVKIIMSGPMSAQTVNDARHRPADPRLLQKPFSLMQLSRELQESLEA